MAGHSPGGSGMTISDGGCAAAVVVAGAWVVVSAVVVGGAVVAVVVVGAVLVGGSVVLGGSELDGGGSVVGAGGVLSPGVVVWISTVLIGMALRAATAAGVAWTFVLVASTVTAVFLLGWRAVFALVARRAATGRE
ncbi:DUF3054 domain-containing protein [Mycolicibacter sinensis]|uniref:Transmembrane protein n=1 Tax=Mycolicibacter sinensis (strain JDM601) TaxID=875328 RepID=A0A1A2XT34_MYCSD|nr:DUF3054 domain-containing protein [Mycolicibacter sinensis]OBI28323.1 hypothetical protein A5710_03855 [Mycolicibacter sinensis]